MLPITIGVYFSISYSWMLLLNSFFVQSYYDEKRRSPSSSSSQVEESYLPCTVDQHGPRISFDLHGPRAMDNIRLAPSLRPAQQLTIMTRTVDHHGPRTMDIIRLPLSLRPAQLTIMGPASDSTIMGPALWISGYRPVFAPHSWSKFKFIRSKLKFYSMFKIIRSKLAFLFVELAFFGKLLLVITPYIQ